MDSESAHDAAMDVHDHSDPAVARRARQRRELMDLVAEDRLQRAADLAHEHLAEFADDDEARQLVLRALHATSDGSVRRRAREFEPP